MPAGNLRLLRLVHDDDAEIPASITWSAPERARPRPATLPEPLANRAPPPAVSDDERHDKLVLRTSLHLPFLGRFQVLLAAGPERRTPERMIADGQGRSLRVAILHSVIISSLAASSGFGFFCFLYLLKCLLNINIFSGQSPLHPLYALMIGG